MKCKCQIELTNHLTNLNKIIKHLNYIVPRIKRVIIEQKLLKVEKIKTIRINRRLNQREFHLKQFKTELHHN